MGRKRKNTVEATLVIDSKIKGDKELKAFERTLTGIEGGATKADTALRGTAGGASTLANSLVDVASKSKRADTDLRAQRATVEALTKEYDDARRQVESFGDAASSLGAIRGLGEGVGLNLGGLTIAQDALDAVEGIGRIGPALKIAGAQALDYVNTLTGLNLTAKSATVILGGVALALGAVALVVNALQVDQAEVDRLNAYAEAARNARQATAGLTAEQAETRRQEILQEIAATEEELNREYERQIELLGTDAPGAFSGLEAGLRGVGEEAASNANQIAILEQRLQDLDGEYDGLAQNIREGVNEAVTEEAEAAELAAEAAVALAVAEQKLYDTRIAELRQVIDLTSQIEQAKGEQVQAEKDAEARRMAAIVQFGEQAAQLEAQRALQDRRQSADQARADARESLLFARDELKQRRKLAEDEQSLFAALQDDLGKLQTDTSQRQFETIQKAQEDERKATKRHFDTLARIQRDARIAIEDAAANLDAEGVFRAKRALEDRTTEENNQYDEQRAERIAAQAQALNDLKTSVTNERAERIAAYQQQLLDTRQRYALEQAQRVEERQFKLRLQQEDRAFAQQRLAEDRALQDAQLQARQAGEQAQLQATQAGEQAKVQAVVNGYQQQLNALGAALSGRNTSGASSLSGALGRSIRIPGGTGRASRPTVQARNLFNIAPIQGPRQPGGKFHGGGIVGGRGDVPILARGGEGVFTPEQMRAMGGVHIQNFSPAFNVGDIGNRSDSQVKSMIMNTLDEWLESIA